MHQRLVSTIGPKLYDANKSQAELEQQVRATLQEVIAGEETPLTMSDRVRIAQEIADDILGYGPIEPFLRDTDCTEVMVNGPFDIWIEKGGKLQRVDGRVQRRGPPAPHDREDRGQGRPSHRRVQPDV